MSHAKPLPVLRVTAAVIRRGGRILIARRAGTGALAGKWEFPGGKIEPGESPEECLARELMEELGMTARVGALIRLDRHAEPGRVIELHFFDVRYPRGPVHLRDHDAVCWVRPADLPGYDWAPADKAFASFLATYSWQCSQDTVRVQPQSTCR